MLKKTLFAMLAMLAISIPAQSIELPAGATPTFENSSTAYSSNKFDNLMAAYGLKMNIADVSGVPSSYAKVSGDKIIFNDTPIAYTPAQYHSIFTAYGLELTPEAVKEKLEGHGLSSYAKVQNDKIVFGNTSTAYGKDELLTILSAYSLPMVAAPVPVPVAEATPMDSDGDGVIDEKDACPGTPMGVAVDERGCWAMTNNLLFDVDKSVIKKEFYPVLDDTKTIFDKYPDMKVQIDGYTDSTGTDAYNQKLSERRANAVKDYLVNSVGIDSNRLNAVGYGESNPAASNTTKEGRAKNRRVEFTPTM